MGYYYRADYRGSSDSPDYYAASGALSRAGVFEEVKTLAELKRRLDTAAHALPVGTHVRTYRVYRMSRGYEPGKPRGGSTDQETDLYLVDKGSFYDPKTGKARPPRWSKTARDASKRHAARRDEPKGPLYYLSYREALQRAKRMARATGRSIRVSRGEDDRTPGREEFAVSQVGHMPKHFYEVARVESDGTVRMGGGRYHRMMQRRETKSARDTRHSYVTDSQLHALAHKAHLAGDTATARIASSALRGNPRSRREAARIVHQATTARDSSRSRRSRRHG